MCHNIQCGKLAWRDNNGNKLVILVAAAALGATSSKQGKVTYSSDYEEVHLKRKKTLLESGLLSYVKGTHARYLWAMLLNRFLEDEKTLTW